MKLAEAVAVVATVTSAVLGWQLYQARSALAVQPHALSQMGTFEADVSHAPRKRSGDKQIPVSDANVMQRGTGQSVESEHRSEENGLPNAGEPAGRAYLHRMRKNEIGRQYAEVLRRLDLSDAERERVVSLLVISNFSEFRDGRTPQEVHAEIRALLGEDRMQMLYEHQRRAPYLQRVDQLNVQLAAQDMPLNAATREAFVQAFVDGREELMRASMTKGLKPDVDDFAKRVERINEADRQVLLRVDPLLNADQHIFLQYAFQQVAQDRLAELAWLREQAAADPSLEFWHYPD